MGSIFKRPEILAKEAKDRKFKGKWTIAWTDENGKRQKKVCHTDKLKSQAELARIENEVADIKAGISTRSRSDLVKSANVPLDSHVEDYRLALLAKGGTGKHAANIASAIRRLFEAAKVKSLADMGSDRIAKEIGRIKAAKSARTANHARGAVKAFAKWLMVNGRIKDVPLPILALEPHNVKADRKRVRRAIGREEMARFLAVVEAAEPIRLSKIGYCYEERWITGPERAALYRLALGTGFRSNEIRTLTPEQFHLDGDRPSIVLLAENEKNRKGATQPISRDLAESFRAFLEGKPRGQPVFPFPYRTAKMLRKDLALAGIPYRDAEGHYLDFHALRASFITHLSASGANPKEIQKLARHSTITLTMDGYAKASEDDLRAVLEKLE